MGNIFEGGVDLTVLPCSAKGTVSSATYRWVETFGLPKPEKANLPSKLGDIGAIFRFPGPAGITKYYCYAASVLNDHSNEEAIRSIGTQLGAVTFANGDIRIIEAPLLGTGAGGLKSVVSASALAKGFKSAAKAAATLFIFAFDRERFELLQTAFARGEDDLNTVAQVAVQTRAPLEVFISHSSKDAEIAAALIDVIRAATDIPHDKIRCTSVDGYRLPGGASSDEQLKSEVREATFFIGLLTPFSVNSSYVLFELGARWGAKLPLVPLLAAGMQFGDLKAPLSSLNALSCSSAAQIHQLMNEIAGRIGRPINSAATYDGQLQRLMKVVRSNEEAGQVEGIEIGSKQIDHPTTEKQSHAPPATEAGQELLKLIQSESDPEARGLVKIQKEIMPGTTHFFPKLQYAGSPLAIKTKHFRQGVAELVELQWLEPPEENESTNTLTYEYREPEN